MYITQLRKIRPNKLW